MRNGKHYWRSPLIWAGILVLTMVFAFGLKPEENQVYGASGVPLNTTTFPDKAFRTYIALCFDYNDDYYLSAEEIRYASYISFSEDEDLMAKYVKWEVKSLKGIEYLKNLTVLECAGHKITTLDLSHNKELMRIDCRRNQIRSLNLSKNKNLDTIKCGRNKMTSLNVTGLKHLKELSCSKNSLKTLSLKGAPALTELKCGNNKLTKLNISACKKLEHISCYKNKLTKLNVTRAKKLDYLNCGGNRLKRLNLSKNRMLDELFCDSNRLTSLNLSSTVDLRGLVCDDNRLVSGNLGISDKAFEYSFYFTISPQKKTVRVKKTGKYYWAKLPKMSKTRIKKLSSGTIGKYGIYWKSYKKVPKKVTYNLKLFKSGKSYTKVTLILKKGKVKSGTLNKKKVTLKKGKTAKLKVKLKPSYASNRTIKWTSSKKKIVKVSKKGIIKALRKGKATVTAKLSNGKKLRCKVTVK